MRIAQSAVLVLAGLAVSCGPPATLEVRPFLLDDLEVEDNREPMIRHEQQRRFYGAVGVREREQRLGHYYTILWHDEKVSAGPVRVVFEYQQGATGSQVLRKERRFEPGAKEGKAEFEVTGDDFFEGGRVLAWRATLWRGEQIVERERSYLWE